MDNDDNLEIMKKEMSKIKVDLLEKLENYNKTLSYMAGDAPIGVLCLPKTTETILINAGCLRIYDLIDRDLTKIKGIGHRRIGDLTARLDKFLSMS